MAFPIPMARRLPNYLRTYRRRFGLSQEEVAMLLGVRKGTKVSRYENLKRLPGTCTVFACEIMFRRCARELFAGTHEEVRRRIEARARRLAKILGRKPADSRTARKIAFLRSITEPDPASE